MGVSEQMNPNKIAAAVFDTIEGDLAVTAAAVGECCGLLGWKAEIREFSDARAFVLHCRDNRLDMVFIGIGSMRDVETARSVARLSLGCPLFFVSEPGEISNYGREGRRLGILHYLDKPATCGQVREAVGRIELPFPARRCRPNNAAGKIQSPY